MNMFSKKNILVSSLLLSVLGVVLGRMSDNGSCGQLEACLLLAYPLLVFIPVFIFSLATFYLKEDVFTSWRKMTSWWVITAVILVAISPTDHADMIGFEKKSALFLLACLYIAISLILITWKWFTLRGKK